VLTCNNDPAVTQTREYGSLSLGLTKRKSLNGDVTQTGSQECVINIVAGPDEED
jgi:hypothetical protein